MASEVLKDKETSGNKMFQMLKAGYLLEKLKGRELKGKREIAEK